MFRRHSLTIIATAAVLSGAARPAAATLTVTTSANVAVPHTIVSAAGPLPASETWTYRTPDGNSTQTAIVSGLADYGVLKGSALATTTGQITLLTGVTLSWSDTLTVDLAGHTGEAGFVYLPMLYSWQLYGTGTGSSTGGVGLTFGSNRLYVGESAGRQCSSPSNCTFTDFYQRSFSIGGQVSYAITPGPITPVAIPIIFGQTYTIGEDLAVSGYAAATWDLPAKTTADASHSIYWGGIRAITDANGNAVLATLTSGTGTDYARSFAPAVPEPANAALMAAGLAVLLAVCRRRNREADSEGP